MNPAVSIILTVYKRTQYIEQAIRSALEQTFRSFEIIVTDDSNSEQIRAICESFQRPEIRYRTNPTNLGVVHNLRAAVSEAQADLVSVLNDDDYWTPRFLERLVPPLQAKADRVLAFSDHYIVEEDGRIDTAKTELSSTSYGRSVLPEGEVADFQTLALNKGVPLAMAAVFRKDAIDWNLLTTEVSGAYDFWIVCLLAATGKPAYFVPEKLTYYREHGAMETVREAPDKNEHLIYIYRELLEHNRFPDRRAFLRENYSQALRLVGKDRLRFDQVSNARRCFRDSLRVIFSLKSLVLLGVGFLPKFCRVGLKYTRV